VNLPNSITLARILVAPLIAWMAFAGSWQVRFAAWALFIAASVSDYYDGKLARSRALITDLGKLLDPLADKLLLLATVVPMYILQRPPEGTTALEALHAARTLAPGGATDELTRLPFVTPVGLVPLPLWIVVLVLGRELFMTILRQIAARQGVVIAAIGPAKWKAGFQYTWVGAAFFWFGSAVWARDFAAWDDTPWRLFAHFNGIVGTLSMAGALFLTLYSLWLYVRRYGGVLTGRRVVDAGPL
jgi:phosphatidylglycerophosphate synthase